MMMIYDADDELCETCTCHCQPTQPHHPLTAPPQQYKHTDKPELRSIQNASDDCFVARQSRRVVPDKRTDSSHHLTFTLHVHRRRNKAIKFSGFPWGQLLDIAGR